MSCFSCLQNKEDQESNNGNDNLPVAQPKETPGHPPPGHKELEQEPVFAEDERSTKNFNFRELAMATKNFRQECLLGEGGFGRIFKGTLKDSGQIVAVRQLDRNGIQQEGHDFILEIAKLNLLEHPNLLRLIGYCADGEQRLLVYEYMPLGSLKNNLFDLPAGKKPLDWSTRMKIALGVAEGLEYLHEKADPPLIYRDLKSSNILLGEDKTPRLSEYGLANFVQTGNKMHTPRVVSHGYCAPEYENQGELSVKSDVYSFGVIVLELITGRKALDPTRPTDEQNLVKWAQPYFKDQSKFADMADPLLRGGFSKTSLNQAVGVAAMCLQEEPSARPFISDISAALSFLAMAPPEAPIPTRLVSILSSRVSSISQHNDISVSGKHDNPSQESHDLDTVPTKHDNPVQETHDSDTSSDSSDDSDSDKKHNNKRSYSRTVSKRKSTKNNPGQESHDSDIVSREHDNPGQESHDSDIVSREHDNPGQESHVLDTSSDNSGDLASDKKCNRKRPNSRTVSKRKSTKNNPGEESHGSDTVSRKDDNPDQESHVSDTSSDSSAYSVSNKKCNKKRSNIRTVSKRKSIKNNPGEESHDSDTVFIKRDNPDQETHVSDTNSDNSADSDSKKKRSNICTVSKRESIKNNPGEESHDSDTVFIKPDNPDQESHVSDTSSDSSADSDSKRKRSTFCTVSKLKSVKNNSCEESHDSDTVFIKPDNPDQESHVSDTSSDSSADSDSKKKRSNFCTVSKLKSIKNNSGEESHDSDTASIKHDNPDQESHFSTTSSDSPNDLDSDKKCNKKSLNSRTISKRKSTENKDMSKSREESMESRSSCSSSSDSENTFSLRCESALQDNGYSQEEMCHDYEDSSDSDKEPLDG